MKATKTLRILVSNDDGIHAPGIHALVTELRKVGDVTVFAPDKQMSAVGHAITVNYPLRASKYFKGKEFFGYAVEGTPADCVKLAIRTLLDRTPDVLVSGINHGSNTAINIIYSGTVSAATEGTILGIPSVAVSLSTWGEPDFAFAARFSAKLAQLVARNGLPRGTLLNVNVPAIAESEVRGVALTRQGKTQWDDRFEVRRDPNNKEYYWLSGNLEVIDRSSDTDEIAVRNNRISITPIHYDLTDYATLKKIKRWKFGDLLSRR